MALPASFHSGVKAKKRIACLLVLESLRAPLDELRVFALMLHMTGKAKLVLVPVKPLAFTDTSGHLGMAGKTPPGVHLSVEGVTGNAAIFPRELGMEPAQGTRGFSRFEILTLGSREETESQNTGQGPFHHRLRSPAIKVFRLYVFDLPLPSQTESPQQKISLMTDGSSIKLKQ